MDNINIDHEYATTIVYTEAGELDIAYKCKICGEEEGTSFVCESKIDVDKDYINQALKAVVGIPWQTYS